MLEAIEDALAFVADRQRADLDSDKMLRFALVRCVEIVGEAAGRLGDATQRASPDIPWAAMVGMRNRLVHAYFDVDTEIVWKTVTIELPALAVRLRRLLQDQQ